MDKNRDKLALLTGASSGIGEATAFKLKHHGFVVFGAARRVDRMQNLAKAGNQVLALGVTDDASMRAGIEQITATPAASTCSSTMPATVPKDPSRMSRRGPCPEGLYGAFKPPIDRQMTSVFPPSQ